MSESNSAVLEKAEKSGQKPGHKAPPPPQPKPLAGQKAIDQMLDDTAASVQSAFGDRKPQLGERIIYSLGHGSERAGEFRSATVAYVWPDDSEYPGTINLVWLVGRREDSDVNKGRFIRFDFYAGGVEYDPTGKPGTWHYPEDVPTENPTGKKSREERANAAK